MTWQPWLIGLAIAMFAWLALSFWRTPALALARTGHRAEALPEVLGGRYLGMALVLAAAWYGGGVVAAGLVMGAIAVQGLVDAAIYARRGYGVSRHVAAAVVGATAAALLVGSEYGV